MTSRREDWPDALNDWVDAHRATPFAWGSWDCCAAAADWVCVCTNQNLFSSFRKRYSNAHGALGLIKEAGSLRKLVDGLLDLSIAAAFARRGDVVLVEIEGRESLAVCLGSLAAGPGEAGMVFVKPEGWLCAWHV